MPRRHASDPAVVARRRAAEREALRDPANWGVDREALRLAANAEVDTRVDLAGRTVRACRRDVFDLFLDRGRLTLGAHDAVRRLQDDMALLHRAPGGVASYAPRIDRSWAGGDFSETRHRAGLRIDAVLSHSGPVSARLIAALVESVTVLGCPADWRVVVERETGERLADAQGAALRAACENLAGAYALIDRQRRT